MKYTNSDIPSVQFLTRLTYKREKAFNDFKNALLGWTRFWEDCSKIEIRALDKLIRGTHRADLSFLASWLVECHGLNLSHGSPKEGVYLVTWKKTDQMKIGHSVDVKERIDYISKCINKDVEMVLAIKGKVPCAWTEKAIQGLFCHHSTLPPPVSDGYNQSNIGPTEWFIKCSELVYFMKELHRQITKYDYVHDSLFLSGIDNGLNKEKSNEST